MIDEADADLIANKVAAILKRDKRTDPALLTIPEVAAKYRQDKETIRKAARGGLVKCVSRKPRHGRETFMIDAKDAERVWGAH